MNRKIAWRSAALDEIELIYEKAENDQEIAALLEALEAQTLDEAKMNIGMLRTDKGSFLKPEQFDGLPDIEKETVIKVLGNAGIACLDTDLQTATILVKLSPIITEVQGCTVFNILNRLEKLDGSITVIKPKWTLELLVPPGGRKGLFRWEMLIMQLYPWLSVREGSATEAAAEEDTASTGKREKKSLWKRIIG